jgi:hypothetical protein
LSAGHKGTYLLECIVAAVATKRVHGCESTMVQLKQLTAAALHERTVVTADQKSKVTAGQKAKQPTRLQSAPVDSSRGQHGVQPGNTHPQLQDQHIAAMCARRNCKHDV